MADACMPVPEAMAEPACRFRVGWMMGKPLVDADNFALLIQLPWESRATLETAAKANGMSLDRFVASCVENCVEAVKRLSQTQAHALVAFRLVGELGQALRTRFCGEALREFDSIWECLLAAETVDDTEIVRRELAAFLANPPKPEPGQRVERLRLPDEFEKPRGVLN